MTSCSATCSRCTTVESVARSYTIDRIQRPQTVNRRRDASTTLRTLSPMYSRRATGGDTHQHSHMPMCGRRVELVRQPGPSVSDHISAASVTRWPSTTARRRSASTRSSLFPCATTSVPNARRRSIGPDVDTWTAGRVVTVAALAHRADRRQRDKTDSQTGPSLSHRITVRVPQTQAHQHESSPRRVSGQASHLVRPRRENRR